MARFFIAFTFVLLTASLSYSLELNIKIFSEPVVKDSTFELQSVARISCVDRKILKKTAEAVVKLENNYITPSDIIKALSKAGVGGVTLKLSMADRVRVVRNTDLEEWLCRISGWSGIIVIREKNPIPNGYRLEPPDRLYPGTETVNLKLKGPSGTVVKAIHVKWLVKSAVAARPLRRGQVIKSEDVVLSTVEYERNRSYIEDPSSLVGRKVTRSMAKGEPFIERQTDNVDMIKSGNKVRIVCQIGSLSVFARGRALESGSVGETIRVRNDRTRKIVIAKVKASGIVEVIR